VKDEKVEEDDVEEENENVEEDDVEEADRSQDRDPHFVRACAVEMHVSILQEPFRTGIYKKNAGAQSEHPAQAPAFTPNVKAPQ